MVRGVTAALAYAVRSAYVAGELQVLPTPTAMILAFKGLF